MRNDHGESMQLFMSTLLITWGITVLIVTMQIVKHLTIAYKQHKRNRKTVKL